MQEQTITALRESLAAAGLPFVQDEPLAGHTTFKIGGPAAFWCTPHNAEELRSTLALCRENGMPSLVERWNGEDVPSRAFSDGGIHEAIADYEDTVFYEILAEELARRDMDYQPVSNENYDALVSRMDDYIAEFEAHGTDNISIPTMDE